MNVTILQIHKRDSYQYKFIQDKYALDKSNKSFAIADGTTQSFNSENWARLLTSLFVKKPLFEPNQIIEGFSKLTSDFEGFEFKYSENPAKASLEKAKKDKGGTSTFLGVQFISQNLIKVISCGDSNLFVLNEKSIKTSYPFTNLDSLDENNFFINTEALKKNEIDTSFFKTTEIELQGKEKILLATDALSRLILMKNTVANELSEVSNFDELHNFCHKYWDSNELQEDDITAFFIDSTEPENYKEIIPPLNFEYPKTEVPEFIPSSMLEKNQLNFTDMQMDEIKSQFNGVANDFHFVKQKLRTNNLLMILVIFLLSINLIFLFMYRPKNYEQNQVIKTEKSKISNEETTPIKTSKIEKERVKVVDTNQ